MAVVGSVGVGKTTILASMLGETEKISGEKSDLRVLFYSAYFENDFENAFPVLSVKGNCI